MLVTILIVLAIIVAFAVVGWAFRRYIGPHIPIPWVVDVLTFVWIVLCLIVVLARLGVNLGI